MYGESSFEVEILVSKDYIEAEKLNKLEISYIKEYESTIDAKGYNITYGGEGSIPTEELRERFRQAQRGKLSNLTFEEVGHLKMALYCCMDRKEISQMFGISEKAITQIATGRSFYYIYPELNDEIHNLKQRMIDERNGMLLRLFDSGKTITQIVKETGYSVSVVEKCVYKYRNSVQRKNKKNREVYDKVWELHNKGLKNYHIAKELKISPSTVQRYLDNSSNPYKELPFKKIKEMYFEKGMSGADIAKELHISDTTIMSHINHIKYANTEVI